MKNHKNVKVNKYTKNYAILPFILALFFSFFFIYKYSYPVKIKPHRFSIERVERNCTCCFAGAWLHLTSLAVTNVDFSWMMRIELLVMLLMPKQIEMSSIRSRIPSNQPLPIRGVEFHTPNRVPATQKTTFQLNQGK